MAKPYAELKKKIETFIGMPTTFLKASDWRGYLMVCSPTGRLVGRVEIYLNAKEERWKFGGLSMFLPNESGGTDGWNTLCDL